MIRTATVALLAALPLSAQAKSAESSSSSSTHRVVVINGEKVVDEKTVDGRRVPSDVGSPATTGDADAMLRDMLRRMRGELPPEARGLLDDLDLGRAHGASSSHSRRVVVRNGEVVVDEETRDGVPVRRDLRAPAGRAGAPSSARAEARASASDSASSSDQSSSSSSGSKTSGGLRPIAPLPPGTLPPKPTPPSGGGARPVPPRPLSPRPRSEPAPTRPTERPVGRPVRTVPPRIR